VARDMGDGEFFFNELANEWKSALNPLEGLEILDRARWKWVTEREERYGFSDEEVATYTAKLMILQRSRRMGCGGMESMMMGNC